MKLLWVVFLFLMGHLIAGSLAFAQETPAEVEVTESFEPEVLEQEKGNPVQELSEAPAPGPQDECATVLPALEEQLAQTDRDLRSSEKTNKETYQNYLSSFNQMTTLLFDLAKLKREEVEKINEAENSLKESLVQFNEKKDVKSSQDLQEQYMNLTVRLYSAAMDSQKIVDDLKSSLAKVESARSHYEALKLKPEELDKARLELEGKLISLKIRCRG